MADLTNEPANTYALSRNRPLPPTAHGAQHRGVLAAVKGPLASLAAGAPLTAAPPSPAL
jgi:hypothetical protein